MTAPRRDPLRAAARGTSLIELSLVVFVIGIMCVTAFGYYMGERDEARATATRAKAAQIRQAFRQYLVDHGQFPRSMSDMKGRYLKQVPVTTAWGHDFKITFEASPKLVYSTWRGTIERKYAEDLLDPWGTDLLKGMADFGPLFAQKSAPAKMMIGKKWVQSRIDTRDLDGFDALGRPVYNELQGSYVFDATLELRLVSPDNPETTENDPGYDIAFTLGGGYISQIKKNTEPTVWYGPEDAMTRLDIAGTEENLVMEIGISDCHYLSSFAMEIYKPAIGGTRVFYGNREALTLPPRTADVIIDPDTGYEVRVMEPMPVRLERYLHEVTRIN